jgi:hypothetical protein
MTDESQIEIPASFIALYVAPSTSKLLASRAEIAEHYELCEDLANMLTETASTMQFQLGITERDVIERVLLGLTAEGAVISVEQAHWVSRRLQELMGWNV